MIRSARLPVAALFFAGMATATFTGGCTNQPYTSPQQQAQNACQAFGPKTLSGAAIGEHLAALLAVPGSVLLRAVDVGRQLAQALAWWWD